MHSASAATSSVAAAMNPRLVSRPAGRSRTASAVMWTGNLSADYRDSNARSVATALIMSTAAQAPRATVTR
jgi:hypothetical protein